MKKMICLLLLAFFHDALNAQDKSIDSLKDIIYFSKTDKAKVNALYTLSDFFMTNRSNPDSSLPYAYQALELSKKINYREGEVTGLSNIGLLLSYKGQIDSAKKLLFAGLDINNRISPQKLEMKLTLLAELANASGILDLDSARYYCDKILRQARSFQNTTFEAIAIRGLANAFLIHGSYPETMKLYYRYKQIAETNKEPFFSASSYRLIGNIYSFQNNIRQAIRYYDTAALMAEKLSDGNEPLFHYFFLGKQLLLAYVFGSKARSYLKLNILDSALLFARQSFEISNKAFLVGSMAGLYVIMGKIYEGMGIDSIALNYFRTGILFSLNHKFDPIEAYNGLADYFCKTGNMDSCIIYANKALGLIQNSQELLDKPDTYGLLLNAYKSKRNLDSVLKYMDLMHAARDSILGAGKIEEMQLVVFDEEQQRKQQEASVLAYKNKVKFISLFAGIALLFVVAGLLWRSTKVKQKSYVALKKQQEETDFQRKKAEQTLEKLQNTQSQLIQSEKMASLGELTAGIAHEIQNPLNFVNNFSEVNTELLQELKAEGLKLKAEGNDQWQEILDNVINNEEKIIHHGKRADAIVKSMLQHSRTSVGQKELTDINELADEYLRLSYQGFRARDKSFIVSVKTDFDKSMGKMQIIPQDCWIGFSHQLIHHGRQVCDARKPKCDRCNLEQLCHSKDKTWQS